MGVRRTQVGKIVKLYLSGSFFGDAETEQLQKAILDEAAAGNLSLILNMSECQRFNSIAIGVLMRGFAHFRTRGGEIKLCGLGKSLEDLFTMTKVIQLFDHHETQEEAVAAFAI